MRMYDGEITLLKMQMAMKVYVSAPGPVMHQNRSVMPESITDTMAMRIN